MYLISHPTGNQNSRQAALALADAGQLRKFFTALAVPAAVLRLVGKNAIGAELARRHFTALQQQVRSSARIREGLRLLAPHLGLTRLCRHETGWASVDQVYRAVDRSAAVATQHDRKLSAVYCYEDGALQTFTAAKGKGLRCIYELPIGYWRTHRTICEAEAALQPQWAHTWHASYDSSAKLARKDREIALATDIVVPSHFVADSLNHYPGPKPRLHIVPYGNPPAIKHSERRWHDQGVLKLLYVGGLTQRKGLSYLVEALRPLKGRVELRVIGTGAGVELLRDECRLLGSLPHAAVLDAMRQSDVFVFPTLFEGYSLAVAEAMSQGLPVITTPHSGTADIITNGKDGWIVPIRDSVAIHDRIESYLREPRSVQRMGMAALETATGMSWSGYRQRLQRSLFSQD